MALRLSGRNCWISTKCSKDGETYATHVFCLSRTRGLRCPLEGNPGVRPFELGPQCFQPAEASKKKPKPQ